MAAKFDRKNPLPECIAGIKGHIGVSQVSNYSGMPYGNQIWYKEPLTEIYCIDGVKGHTGVSRGQLGVKLLRNGMWAPKFEERILGQSIVIAGVKGHCWGQLGSAMSQIADECPMATKFGRKN